MRPWVFLSVLVIFSASLAAMQVACIALGSSIPDAAGMLFSFGMAIYIVLWSVADARSRRWTPCFDFGFLMAVGFPVSIIWYVLWTRGWKGIFLLMAFLGLIWVPWMATVIAWMVLYG